jgi:hypothetical protein
VRYGVPCLKRVCALCERRVMFVCPVVEDAEYESGGDVA